MGKIKGAYLSLVVENPQELARLAATIRRELGFVPMDQAIPPREPDALHCTVAFFNEGISEEQVEDLSMALKGKTLPLEVDGFGVANGAAAYLSVNCPKLLEIRNLVNGLGLPFTYTDPHLTIGVHPSTLKDVHGVNKKKQVDLPPIKLGAKLHLKQGTSFIW